MSTFGNLSNLGADAATHRRQAHKVRQDFIRSAQNAITDAEDRNCTHAFQQLLAAAEDFGIYQREGYYATSSDYEAGGSQRLYLRAKAAVTKACLRKK